MKTISLRKEKHSSALGTGKYSRTKEQIMSSALASFKIEGISFSGRQLADVESRI